MNFWDPIKTATKIVGTVIIFSTVLFPIARCHGESADISSSTDLRSKPDAQAETTVELTGDQLSAIQIAPVGTDYFAVEKTGIGTINFENNLYLDTRLSTQVFPRVAGTIAGVFVELGDQVKKGQPLYSIESLDTDQGPLIVRSPMSGVVTSVNAVPGLSVQPFNPPAPCSVAGVSTKWLLANVPEADAALYHLGQSVQITVSDFPGRVFKGKISQIYPAIDLTTHRMTFRAVISDPRNELLEGMLADFSAQVQRPVESVALPANGVIREGDGTMTAWVTTDRRHFTQVVVETGLRQNDEVQILKGLKPGEWVVTDGAIFLDNLLEAPTGD